MRAASLAGGEVAGDGLAVGAVAGVARKEVVDKGGESWVGDGDRRRDEAEGAGAFGAAARVVVGVSGGERRLAGGEPEGDRADRVDVGGGGRAASGSLLWGGVAG